MCAGVEGATGVEKGQGKRVCVQDTGVAQARKKRGERSGSAWRELEVGSALLVAPRPYAFILVVPPRARAKEPFAESRRIGACTLGSTLLLVLLAEE